MLKGKNLWIALGVGAVAYYLFMQNKKNQAAKVIAAPATNFTGDLNVLANQNFTGDLGVLNASGPSDRQLNRLERVMTRNPQRAQRMIKRMF
jgi:uncharacterized protein HemX